MKKIINIQLLIAATALLLSTAMASCGSDENENENENLITEQIVLNVQTPGTLASLVGSEKVYQITNLKINGTLNANDIAFIHKMAGDYFYDYNGRLSQLDISGVQFTESEVKDKDWEIIQLKDGVDIYDNMFASCSQLVSIRLPNTSYIGSNAFCLCENLKNIEVPSTVKSIGYGAFSSCCSIESISLPNGLESIGGIAFYGCNALTNISIPNSVTSIGNGAFWGTGLTGSIDWPEKITTIADDVFANCDLLTSVTIPQSVKTIEHGAFQSSGITTITIPSSVSKMGNAVFYLCKNLKDIYVQWTTPISISKNNPFYGENVNFTWSLADQECTLHIPKGSYQNYWNSDWSHYFSKIVEY